MGAAALGHSYWCCARQQCDAGWSGRHADVARRSSIRNRWTTTPHCQKHMVKNPKRLVAVTFLLAAALFELAAVLPMIRGRPLNAAFFGAGLLFLVVGVVKLKASKGTHDGSNT